MTHLPLKTRKKLIEVALPLEQINVEGSRRKRKAPAGYPTTLHKWWAQRPLAAARAVIFAQMVDDPASVPELFSTEEEQQAERERLFAILEDLILWENTANEEVVQRAHAEIVRSWQRACRDNEDHPRAAELFNPMKVPPFHDPFAGGGSLPLEAQRLGLEAFASDLNPVAVLINKAMIEFPARFAGLPPINPEVRRDKALFARKWKLARGLSEDLRYYGRWMRVEAERRIGHLYPKLLITPELTAERPDLLRYEGRELNVVAWLWARTVKSPNPAFAQVEVPLAATFMLSTRKGKEAYVEPVIENGNYRFAVKRGQPKEAEAARNGTKLGRGSNFRCIMSGTPISGNYIKAEGQAKRMGVRLMATVVEGDRERIYLPPTEVMERVAQNANPEWKPEGNVPARLTGGTCVPYGLTKWSDLFTDRQLVALTTFCDLVDEVQELAKQDAISAGFTAEPTLLRDGINSAADYAEAVAVYLVLSISRLADYGSSIATWRPKDNAMRSTMPKQAIQMTWDFAEGSPFGSSSSGFEKCVDVVATVIDRSLPGGIGRAYQASVQEVELADGRLPVVSTDPPYYDNIGYADLSDFFYVWLRRALRGSFPQLFATIATPKDNELVATSYRHGSKANAEEYFLSGMTKAMHKLVEQGHPAFPITIYYAYKQAENVEDAGMASTGWETFLDAVISAGFTIGGTWPMRTEGDNRQVSIGANALASSIVLVCRMADPNARMTTRREFVAALKTEMPAALRRLQEGSIAPVDLAQASIGPGMAVYTRYSQVIDAAGNRLSVREALALVNQVLDEVLAEQEGDFDAETRWALSWFEQQGFGEGEYGVADTLSKAKNTSVAGMVAAGLVRSRGGRVSLLRPEELPGDWDPSADTRLTAWESVHHLIRVLEAHGEQEVAKLAANLGSEAEVARELAYRLFSICDRKKWAQEALAYNGLVQSWPEIQRLAQEKRAKTSTAVGLFAGE